MKKIICLSILLFALSFAQESGFVQEDAHEHGAALLNIAQEGENLFIEFISPSVNLVGFEYQPSTNEEKALVEAAVDDLADASTLFSPATAASCELLNAAIESEIAEDNHEGEEHEEDDEGEVHSEFHASYEFSCTNPEALNGLDLSALFALYPGLQDLDVQYVLADTQGAAELNPESTRLDF